MDGNESLRTNWASYICRTNGIDMHYLRAGGAEPPLIALHGLMGSSACLSPLARTLEAHFDIILPDARGHGKSGKPNEGYRYCDHADDVIGLIEALQLNAPIVLGHSMGGMTAAVVASQIGPRIAGLILIDPTFISPELQREVFESDVAAEHRRSLASTRTDLLADARRRNPHRAPEMLEYLVDARLDTSMAAFEVLTPPNPDYRELVERISVPTLLVIGERGIVSAETASELHARNPLLQFALIADAGHGRPYDQPEQVGAEALAFLNSLPALTASSTLAQ